MAAGDVPASRDPNQSDSVAGAGPGELHQSLHHASVSSSCGGVTEADISHHIIISIKKGLP